MYTTCASLDWTSVGVRGLTREQRFWNKVNKDGPKRPYMDTNCWLWTASTVHGGYGQFDGSRSHRVSFERANGPALGTLDCCHHCDTPACVRPEHLFAGTATENARDMVEKGRYRRGELRDFRFGEACNFASLSAETVRAIRESTGTQRVTAEKFGVNQSTVSRIRNRVRWTRLDGGDDVASPEIHRRAGSIRV